VGYWASTQSTHLLNSGTPAGIRNQKSDSGFGPARSQFLVPDPTQTMAALSATGTQSQSQHLAEQSESARSENLNLKRPGLGS
jgi:hypothetical protein